MIPALIPTERIAPLLRDWMDQEAQTRANLSELTGVPVRRIYAILSGEQDSILFNTADRLLCGMDAVEEWHLSLADLFEQGHDEVAARRDRALQPTSSPRALGAETLPAAAA